MQKYSRCFTSSCFYKKKQAAEADAEVVRWDDDDEKNTQGFKISPDAFVMEGYRDPGYTIAGQPGRSPLGPIGAAVGVFNPLVGAGISSVGNYITS